MSIRLKIQTKDHIVKMESDKKFKVKINDAKQALLKHFEGLIVKTIPKIDQNLIDKGYVYTSNSVIVQKAGSKEKQTYELSSYYPVSRFRNYFLFEPTEKIIKLQEVSAKLKADEQKFKIEMNTVLDSFTTSKLLVEAIPELAIYFKDEQRAKSLSLVPAELISGIRKSIQQNHQVAH